VRPRLVKKEKLEGWSVAGLIVVTVEEVVTVHVHARLAEKNIN